MAKLFVNFTSFACIIFFLVSCDFKSEQNKPEGLTEINVIKTKFNNSATDDVSEIYNCIINSLFDNFSITLVIEELSNTDYKNNPKMLNRVLKNARRELPEISDDVIDSFLEQNKISTPLVGLFDNDRFKVIFIKNDEYNKIFEDTKGKGWDIFYNKYPGSSGIITFSNIGFNTEKNKALVYFANQKGGLDGIGYYILLEKIEGKWILKNKFTAWIS